MAATRSAIIRSTDAYEYQFLALHGQVQRAGQFLADISRPGVDGSAYRKEGKRAPVFELVGQVDCDTVTAADAWVSSLQDRRGELVSVLDDYGTRWDNVAILEVIRGGVSAIRAVAGGLSSSKAVLLTVIVRGQLT